MRTVLQHCFRKMGYSDLKLKLVSTFISQFTFTELLIYFLMMLRNTF